MMSLHECLPPTLQVTLKVQIKRLFFLFVHSLQFTGLGITGSTGSSVLLVASFSFWFVSFTEQQWREKYFKCDLWKLTAFGRGIRGLMYNLKLFNQLFEKTDQNSTCFGWLGLGLDKFSSSFEVWIKSPPWCLLLVVASPLSLHELGPGFVLVMPQVTLHCAHDTRGAVPWGNGLCYHGWQGV